MKLLIIEDEPDLLKAMCSYLEQQAYVCEEASTFATAEDKLATFQYDLVVLDITLPDGNGLQLLKRLKEQHAQTGILIVSAKNSIDDRVQGLDSGADDYITKPFHLAELTSRINAIIRRRNFDGNNKIVFNEIAIDPEERKVEVAEKAVDLTRKEFDLLLYFISNKKRVLTKPAIAEHLWGDSIDMADNFDFVYTHIKNLRKKIEGAGGKDYVKTVYGIGYKFTDT